MVPWKLYLWVWLSIITNINYTNLPCQRQSRRRWLLATKLAILIQLKVVYMKVSGRTSSLLQKQHQQQAYLLPERFLYSLMVSNLLSHAQMFCLEFFCSALTQTVLMCTVTV